MRQCARVCALHSSSSYEFVLVVKKEKGWPKAVAYCLLKNLVSILNVDIIHQEFVHNCICQH